MAVVRIGTTTLRYDQLGSADPPVLLVHGTAAALWGELPARLAARHRVLDYDRRGYGGSDGPPPASLTEHTADAVALLDRIAVRRVVVVGWSVGGIVALDLAVRFPDRVLGLVLVEPPLHAKRHPTPRMLRGVLGGVLHGRRDPRAGADRFLRWALHDTTTRTPQDALPAGWWEQSLDNGAAIVHEIGLGTGEHLAASDLRGLAVPTVVLHGDRSDRALRAAARRTARAVPGARLEAVSGSGHAMQADRPDAIVAAVESLRPVGTWS
jgi:pimeloyl-ACP methyl ester carboxylesterase